MNKKLLLCISLALTSSLAEKGYSRDTQIESYDNRVVGKISVQIENIPEGSSFDKQTIFSKLKTRQGDPFSQYIF